MTILLQIIVDQMHLKKNGLHESHILLAGGLCEIWSVKSSGQLQDPGRR